MRGARQAQQPWSRGAAPRSLTHGRIPDVTLKAGAAGLSTAAGGKEIMLPKHAQCVVVGGGVIGTSVAYHLAQNGWTDIVQLEQNTLTSGTTWHAAGLIGMLRGTETETKLSMYGKELYENLEGETGLSSGFKACGSVSVARVSQRHAPAIRRGSIATGRRLLCVSPPGGASCGCTHSRRQLYLTLPPPPA